MPARLPATARVLHHHGSHPELSASMPACVSKQLYSATAASATDPDRSAYHPGGCHPPPTVPRLLQVPVSQQSPQCYNQCSQTCNNQCAQSQVVLLPPNPTYSSLSAPAAVPVRLCLQLLCLLPAGPVSLSEPGLWKIIRTILSCLYILRFFVNSPMKVPTSILCLFDRKVEGAYYVY